MTQPIILWHRRDLRIRDNRALQEAQKKTRKVYPVFIIDPVFFREDRETCDDRILFMFACLEDLNRQYQEIGSSLSLVFGDSLSKLEALKERFRASIYFNEDTNMRFGLERDRRAREELGAVGFSNDAIIRDKEETRQKWSKQAETYFMATPYPVPNNLNENPIPSETSYATIRDLYGIRQRKSKVPKGGSTEAWMRFRWFLRHANRYSKSISKPYLAEQFTSRLSAHFSFGCISLREVFQEFQNASISSREKRFFTSRLYWNQHFTQKLQDFPDVVDTTINPALEGLHQENHDERLITAWKKGQTGYPLVDASMRALTGTGFLNFRMRAMVASFFCHVLRQYWKIGADFMHYHLLDADTAINYEQWQMQGGLVGVHPLRIYNPTKQVFDNDQEGRFIREYVPELSAIRELEYLAEPTRFAEEIKEQYGIAIGADYPKVIVDFKLASRKTKEEFKALKPAIQEAVRTEEFQRRASLSQRRRNPWGRRQDTRTTGSQRRLDEF